MALADKALIVDGKMWTCASDGFVLPRLQALWLWLEEPVFSSFPLIPKLTPNLTEFT